MTNQTIFLRLILLLATALPACGRTLHRPARDAGFRLDAPREIDDETIAKAFSASPQMPDEARVAYYVFDDDHAAEVEAMLESVPGVLSHHRIPTLLVSGERRFDPPPSPYRSTQTKPVSMKQLRLLAARARADVLVVVDYGYEVRREPNGFTAFGVALVPLLFVPWQDVEVESYADSYVVDVRNGYLYGQVSADEEGSEGLRTIYTDADDRMIDEQLEALMDDTGDLVAKLVAEEQGSDQLASDPSPAVESVPDAVAGNESR